MATSWGADKPGAGVSASGAGSAPRLAPRGALWATVVLALVAMLAAVDRNILALLLVPIKQSLHASDAAMGALSGTAFALVFATAALPVARFADRTNRRNFMVAAVAFWSAMTAVCGFAGSYAQLLLARVGVAAGESASGPATSSLIGDLYPANKRGGAISLLTIGSALGFSLGAIAAGVLNDRFGWHVAMMAVGAPGLALALVLWLTVSEPLRGAHDGGLVHDPEADSIWRATRRIARIRTAAPLMAGMVFLNAAFLAWLTWLPTFLIRIHHLPTRESSAVFGVAVGLGGVLSNVFAGLVSDRLARRGSRWRMYYCCGMIVVATPLLAAAILLRSLAPAVVCMCAFSLAAGGLTTVTGAAQLAISPPPMRAFMAAAFSLAVSVVGGAGPLAVGAMDDALKLKLGDGAIRLTLLLLPVLLALAGVMFFWASRSIGDDTRSASGGTAS